MPNSSNPTPDSLQERLARLQTQSLPPDVQAVLTDLAEENRRLQNALEQAQASKAKYLSVVTHELRIPMTSIKGYTDLLRQGVVGPVNEQQLNFLNVVKNNVDRMSLLVSDLSDLNRMETGRLKLESGWVAVEKPVQDTLHTLRPRIEEKGQTLQVELAENLPKLYVDSNRVVQALTNLVSNAWKYTPEGGQIHLRVQAVADQVRFEVQDNGIGISPEDQTHLFTPFFRSEDQRVRDQQGWGLGLSVACGLVDLMEGQIGANSSPDQGSTFWFSLPARPPEGQAGPP